MSRFAILIVGVQSVNGAACSQAWTGAGTGAWYRIDTDCRVGGFPATAITTCFGSVSIAPDSTPTTLGFYQSYGVFSTSTGHGADIGFGYDLDSGSWGSIYNDEVTGYQNGNVTVVALQNPCVNVTLIALDRAVSMNVTDTFTGTNLGCDVWTHVDPQLGLNSKGTNIGWYRFDSIAQDPPETLRGGVALQHAVERDWMLQTSQPFGDWVDAGPHVIALNNSGYAPGPCCSPAERSTITVHASGTLQYSASNVSIVYPA